MAHLAVVVLDRRDMYVVPVQVAILAVVAQHGASLAFVAKRGQHLRQPVLFAVRAEQEVGVAADHFGARIACHALEGGVDVLDRVARCHRARNQDRIGARLECALAQAQGRFSLLLRLAVAVRLHGGADPAGQAGQQAHFIDVEGVAVLGIDVQYTEHVVLPMQRQGQLGVQPAPHGRDRPWRQQPVAVDSVGDHGGVAAQGGTDRAQAGGAGRQRGAQLVEIILVGAGGGGQRQAAVPMQHADPGHAVGLRQHVAHAAQQGALVVAARDQRFAIVDDA